MENLIIRGFINVFHEYEDGHGTKVNGRMIGDQLEYLSGKFVTANFYISDKEMAIEELQENRILQLSGSLEAEYEPIYSDITGYLYTTENFEIGNHSLIKMLESHDGKFLHLNIIIH